MLRKIRSCHAFALSLGAPWASKHAVLLAGIAWVVGSAGVSAQITPPRSDREATTPIPAATRVQSLDTVEVGRFDGGRMWTFDRPPADYFRSEYAISADSAWFRTARLGALRIPNCSASLISGDGLVLTNHHCARKFVSQVSAPGEQLLEMGFYAETLEDEREVTGFAAEQLIAIRDITRDVEGAIGGRTGPERRERMNEKIADITEDLIDDFGKDDAISVEIVTLYGGAHRAAYVFRKYTDVKLVMTPEVQVGFFGGDADNFNFPRYNLDVALFRLYDGEGVPLQTPDYFRWSAEGIEAGDAVFVVGNPGSTHRAQTIAQLTFRREVEDLKTLDFLNRRAQAFQEFLDAFPVQAREDDIENDWFGAVNAIKATTGVIEGLEDQVLMARKAAAEMELQAAMTATPELRERFGGLMERLARIQDEKRELDTGFGAFLGLTAGGFESSTLHRAFLAFQILNARQAGAPASFLEPMLAQVDSIGSVPPVLDGLLIEARVQEFLDYFDPAEDRWLGSIMRGRTAKGVAAVLQRSILADSATTVDGLRTGRLDSNDPAIRFVSFYAPEYSRFQDGLSALLNREEEIESSLGKARLQLYGWAVSPDATFSPRISDGVVAGYYQDGEAIEPFTTLAGLFERYRALGRDQDGGEAWLLPERWLAAESGLDLSTPLNFTSTLDIAGGNSGSPVLNADLEIVGVVFDGNLASLPGDFIFLPESNRAITVDARAILAVLDVVYGADRITAEIRAGSGAAVTSEAAGVSH